MGLHARSAARSTNQAEPVVALLAVLGMSIVEVPATETLITDGLRESRPANVSPKLNRDKIDHVANQAVAVIVFRFDQYPHIPTISHDGDR